MEDRWAKLEEIVRRVVREELSTIAPQKKTKIGFKNGRFTGIGEQELTAMREAFPAVDIEAQLKEMQLWIITNPDDAPSSNYGAFVMRWLKKHQDQHSLRIIPVKRDDPKEIKRRACAYCSENAVGTVNGINHCRAHYHDAYEERPRRMLGVVAKPVAGAD